MIFVCITIIGFGILIYASAIGYRQEDSSIEKTDKKYRELLKHTEELNLGLENLESKYYDQTSRLQRVTEKHEQTGNKIKKLELKIEAARNDVEKIIKEIDSGNQLVDEARIRNYFTAALCGAEKELDIISSWMNFHVVNDDLINDFRRLLQKDVQIKIIYGIGDELDERRQRTETVARRLRSTFGLYPNFHIKSGNTHQKLFICDDKFYVHSSLNILSKGYLYDTFDESGECSTNINAIEERRKKYFNF